MVAPFKFHVLRPFKGESTYDALNDLFGTPVTLDGVALQRGAQSLQLGCTLAAAAMRPRNFDALVNAFLFAVLGFSLQFALWILSLASFSRSPVMLSWAIAFSWLTDLYYPVGRFSYIWVY